jgi:hypothetical protein
MARKTPDLGSNRFDLGEDPLVDYVCKADINCVAGSWP